jgi:hypothetical protein
MLTAYISHDLTRSALWRARWTSFHGSLGRFGRFWLRSCYRWRSSNCGRYGWLFRTTKKAREGSASVVFLPFGSFFFGSLSLVFLTLV